MYTYLSYLENCQVLKILKTKSWTYTIDFKSFLYIPRYFGQMRCTWTWTSNRSHMDRIWDSGSVAFATWMLWSYRVGNSAGMLDTDSCKSLGSTVVVIFAYIPWMFPNMSRMGMTTVVFLCWCLLFEGFSRTHLKLKRRVRVSHA